MAKKIKTWKYIPNIEEFTTFQFQDLKDAHKK